MIIITGTYPPEKCGVGDYTYHMLHTPEAKNWELFYETDWSLNTFGEKKRKLLSMSSSVINLQYPCVGYGVTLLPHLLCIYFSLFSSKRFSVTIHEYSQLGWKGRLAMMLFLIFSSKLIFTNEFELKYARKHWPWVKRKSAVIKIYSNIKPAAVLPAIEKRNYDVGYFGYIRENKGLEDFIEVAVLLKQRNPQLKIYAMGQTQLAFKYYYEPIIERLSEAGIDLFLNKDADEVSEILAETKVSFLPFPDGVSERRGSFLAVIKNECLVVTKKGPFTTKAHENMCFFAESDAAATEMIEDLLHKDAGFYAAEQKKIQEFLKKEMPQSWNDVVMQYNNFLE